jgi:hypothetical protein
VPNRVAEPSILARSSRGADLLRPKLDSLEASTGRQNHNLMLRSLKQFDGVAIGVFELNLLPRVAEGGNEGPKNVSGNWCNRKCRECGADLSARCVPALASVQPSSHSEQGRTTSRTLSCSTNAGLIGRAGCSNGLPFRHRSPSPMEFASDLLEVLKLWKQATQFPQLRGLDF